MVAAAAAVRAAGHMHEGLPAPWCARPPDEIDAIGTKRYESHSGGEREIQRTMLELLNQMDGFDAMSEVRPWKPRVLGAPPQKP